jgi:succinoglycan biosynthesis protein ExoA
MATFDDVLPRIALGPAGEIPHVVIVIPTLNEEKHIRRVIAEIGEPPFPHTLWVADGGSSDRTLEIVGEIAAEGRDVLVHHNHDRIQASGVNGVAFGSHDGEAVMVRIDAHSRYPAGFVEKVVRKLIETGARSVVVPLITEAGPDGTRFAHAVEVAQRSRLGNGGSAHRLASPQGRFVDHGHHAGFDIDCFRALGGYDQEFATNEDAEYDHRLSQAGGRVWLEPSAAVSYSPRQTLRALSIQYFRYGQGRAMTILKHAIAPKPRQMLPLAVLCGNAISAAVALVWLPAAIVPLAYGLACLGGVIVEWKRQRGEVSLRDGAAVGMALSAMHMCWGAGFIRQVIRSEGLAASLKAMVFRRSDRSVPAE